MTRTEIKVLLVDDDPEITKSISTYLETSGYRITALNSSEQFEETLRTFDPDIIILDIIMPRVDGFELCRLVRRSPAYYPIIMLTSKSDVVDKVVGLEMGADDYISKPFSLRELEARIKSVLRRMRVDRHYPDDQAPSQTIFRGDIVIDLSNRILKIGNRKIDLTPKEFELMKLFLSNPGKAFNRDELLEKVWGSNYKGYHRTIDSHINRLRLKIETNPDQPEIISTVWGVGYKLNEDYQYKR